MRIDVWSDVVWPWCFIGHRRLEKAIAQFPQINFQVSHRAFQLQPDLNETVPTSEYLAQKYRVGAEQVAAMQENVCSIADGEGLCYNLADTLSGNTMDAHRLILWARTQEKETELLEAMFSSYFEKQGSLFTHKDLLTLVASVGLDSAQAQAILESDSYRNEVIHDQQLASKLGATGVPFFVVNGKYGISGAQPLEVFTKTLEAALSDEAYTPPA